MWCRNKKWGDMSVVEGAVYRLKSISVTMLGFTFVTFTTNGCLKHYFLFFFFVL